MGDSGGEARPASARVSARLELFGTARMACGVGHLDLRLPADACVADFAAAAADACPALVGVALRPDLSGLLESYTLNLNGAAFLTDCPTDGHTDSRFRLSDGDALLLFSSQAGG